MSEAEITNPCNVIRDGKNGIYEVRGQTREERKRENFKSHSLSQN